MRGSRLFVSSSASAIAPSSPDESVPRDAYLRTERPSGHFAIRLSVPPSVERQGIRATHSDGVLEVRLPKRRDELASKITVSIH